ncbi:MAG: response regulator [Acidimicrobiales bacterium]
MARVVVCDDDAVVRASITTLCEDAGLQVVAETDNGGDAAEMVRRFGVDVLVLDLSLADGTGERTLELLDADGAGPAVVVFTSFADDAGRLLRKGAREVIEKPDFELLGDVLSRMGTSVDAATARSEERRLASRQVPTAAQAWRSPSGVSSRPDLAHSLSELEVGDSIVAVTLVGLEQVEANAGPLLAADCRLAVAAALRSHLRIQDLLHEAPEVAGFIALLRGGDARAMTAMWSRLSTALGTWAYGELRGAATRVDAMGANDGVARVIGALQSASPSSATFLAV